MHGGASLLGRLIRVERGSLLRLCGKADMPLAELPRWVTLKQAAEYYQVSPHLIRALIAHEQLDARRIGSSAKLPKSIGTMPATGALTEAAVGLQVQESTAEVPGLEAKSDRTCLGIDMHLSSLPLSRNRSRMWENEIVDHRARSKDRTRGGAMSVSEAFRGVIDESVASTELATGANGSI